MEREKLFMYFEKRHSPKREMLSRIPLGVQPESLWQELLNARKSKSTSLPLYSPKGMPYWYVTTEKMILASEKIVETLFEYETEFDPYEGPSTVSNLEEVFYTSFVEGAQITMHEAMKFLSEERQPKDIEEQLIANNRAAGGFAAKHLGGTVDEPFLRELNALFTDGMEGGGEYRLTENTDYISPGGEKHAFIKPSMLSDRVKDLCAFLDLPEIHPLIKAAAAQGYILVLRPFAEGNERLGRILSSMVLHRCGYGFFGEVSLSALIARKSYAYYEAAENTLREENGGDFTYFIEYFLELLSRAVDERRYRLMQRNELRLRREAELARQPLAENNTEPDIDEHSGKSESDEKAGDDSNIKAQLQECLHSKGALTRKLAGLLLNMLENGQKAFTVADIRNGCAAAPNQAQGLIKRFKGMGLIESCEEQSGAYTVYRIKEASPRRLSTPEAAGGDYSEAFYNQLSILSDSANSCRDKRLADSLRSCLEKGIMARADYDARGYTDWMWHSDTKLALQLGLISKQSDGVYKLNRDFRSPAPELDPSQKKTLSAIYETFGEREFSKEMFIATLNYSKSYTSASLHKLTLLRILDQKSTDAGSHYRLLVNPGENPEYFDFVA